MYTTFQLKKDMDRKLRSGGTSQLNDFQGTVDEARRNVLRNIRPEELIRKGYLEQAIYPHVNRYAAFEEMKYKDIINIKKLPAHRNVDVLMHESELVYSRRFSQKRRGARNAISVGYENGVKYIQVDHPRGLKDCQEQIINRCESLTENGTWNVGGNLIDLTADHLNRISGKGSLKFSINTSGTSGQLQNFTLTPFSLFDFLEKGAVFLWLSLSIPKEMVAVKLIMGSDNSNLNNDIYTLAVNRAHDDVAFIDGWNLLKYPISDMQTVGTPNPHNLTHIRVEFETTGQAIPDCRLDLIVARKGEVYEVAYNGTYIFRDANTNAWKKYTTDNSDIIVAEEDTYQLLMLEASVIGQKEIFNNSGAAKSDVSDIEDELKEAYRLYNMEHPSEALLPTDNIYTFGTMLDGYSSDLLWDGGFDRDQNNGNQN